MSIIEAILLGILQGATEFLPVSSSGHLVLFPAMFGMTQPSLTVIAVAHEGTLLAVIIYFRRDIWAIIKGVVQGLMQRDLMGTTDSRLGWFIAVGSIPAAAAGLLLEDYFETIFGTPVAAAVFLLITALILVIGEQLVTGLKNLDSMGWKDAIIIGICQMFALFPGISRSGITITGGLGRGLDRPTAARYSFLLGIPAILGAGLLSLMDLIQEGNLAAQGGVLLVTFIAAAVTGYLCIYFLLAWLRRHKLYIFAVYCALLGGGFLVWTFLS